ncbi:MAG TPA: oligosaccharide flippase family protein [Thermoleophilaceae bacterium]|nr:oligosaccharide flippase family protein [Thermoleophilaceae bacterium]
MDPRTARGVLWTVTSFGANRVVTVVTTIVLARLLVPSDFGLFALATLVVNFVSLFSGFGLGNALVLGKDLDDRARGTILTLLIALGVFFALALAAASPLLAEAMGQPRLDELLVAIAAVLSITGANWFYDSVLQKELAFRERFFCQLARTIAYAVVALVLAAAADAGVWALIAGFAAGHLANGVALLLLTPYRVRPAWDGVVARGAIKSGRGFVVQDSVDFAQQSVDYIVIGRVLGATSLGYYTLAFRQAEIPFYAIGEPVSRVLFPGFADMRHRGEDTRAAFLNAMRLLAFAAFPLGAVLSGAAAPFVETFFGDKWLPMIGALQVLGLWALGRPLEHATSWYLNAHEHAVAVGRVALVLLPLLVVAIYLAADLGGITTVAWVMVGHVVASGAAMMVLAHRRTHVPLGRQLAVLLGPAVGAAAAWAASRGVTEATESMAPLFSLALASLAGLAAYTAGVGVAAPSLIGEATGRFRGALRRGDDA